MTEREKMLAGLLYNPMDEELVERRAIAQGLCLKLRLISPADRRGIIELTTSLFGQPTDSIYITPPFFCDYGCNIKFGANFYCNTDCVILDCAPVTIGDNVLLGPKVQIYTPLHHLDADARNDLEYARPVTIGDKVWIGGGAIVCPGVMLGEGCVVGAGSVVTRDVEPYTLAAGNPCRFIRRIGSKTSVESHND